MRLKIKSASYQGLRSYQEDACGWFPTTGIAVVCDGMGGHRGGAEASAAVVDFFSNITDLDPDEFKHKVTDAQMYLNSNRLFGGTTIVAILFYDTGTGRRARIIWAGDSRVYAWRNNVLLRLTTDHNRLAQIVKNDGISEEEAAKKYPGASCTLTNNMGLGIHPKHVFVSEKDVPATEGTYFILATDGLWDEYSDLDLQQLLKHTTDPDKLCKSAIGDGSSDNVTVMIAKVLP